jgi:lipoyl(octanoyl) transferase
LTALPASRPGAWSWLGRVPFTAAAALQERLRAQIAAGDTPDTVLLCEHDPVVTLGRRARPEHLLLGEAGLARRGIAVARASRGGEVTYHGPGQLVCYPVVRLRRGVLAHVQAMAEAVIALLADLGIAGQWRRSSPGVWVGSAKICAFGIHVRHRIAIHGLALNVNPDLSAFSAIVPCGMPGVEVTSIARLAASAPAPTPATLVPALARALGRTLGLELCELPAERLGPLPDCQIDRETDNMIHT